MATRTDIFTWRFFDEIAWWAIGLASACAIAGVFVTGGWTFSVTCLAVTAADVALVHFAARRGGLALQGGSVDPAAFALFGARIALKAVVLVAALLAPAIISFWGAVVGAVVYDMTLAFAGSALSAVRIRSQGR